MWPDNRNQWLPRSIYLNHLCVYLKPVALRQQNEIESRFVLLWGEMNAGSRVHGKRTSGPSRHPSRVAPRTQYSPADPQVHQGHEGRNLPVVNRRYSESEDVCVCVCVWRSHKSNSFQFISSIAALHSSPLKDEECRTLCLISLCSWREGRLSVSLFKMLEILPAHGVFPSPQELRESRRVIDCS